MPTTPSPDVFVRITPECHERIDSAHRSLLYTRKLIISSHQHLRESRDALRRADELIRRVARSTVMG